MNRIYKLVSFLMSLVDPVANDMYHKGYVEVDGTVLMGLKK